MDLLCHFPALFTDEKILNPVWSPLSQTTQLCDLCCGEETLTRLAYCDVLTVTFPLNSQ